MLCVLSKMTAPKSDDVYLKLILVKVLLRGPKNSREAVKHFGPAPGVTVTLSHMLGRRERSLRKLKEGERVVDSTSKKNLSSFVFLGLRIKFLVGNTGSSLPFALPNHNCNISSIISPKKKTLGSASHKKTSFVVKAASTPPVKQGANRPLWFASSQSLTYFDGSLPGDYGFDPLGLSDPEGHEYIDIVKRAFDSDQEY